MQTKITKRIVDAIEPNTIIWDSEIKGFGVRRRSGVTTFVLKYRAGGRQRWYKLGMYPNMPTEDARRQAKIEAGAIEKGADPAATRYATRAAPTVADLCERFLSEHSRQHKKLASIAADERNIRNHVLPILRTLKVADVKRADVDRLKTAIAKGKTARDEKPDRKHARIIVRGGQGAANRTVTLLHKIFSMAELWGWRPEGSNPCARIAKYRERGCERFLSADELARLGEVLTRFGRDGLETPQTVAAIRLLIFTGCRRDEVLTLRWEYFESERQCLRLPDSKTGAKTIYLAPPALEVLAGLARVERNPFVIVGTKKGEHLVGIEKAWQRIRQRTTLEIWKADKDAGALIAELEKERGAPLTCADVLRAAKSRKLALPAGMLDVRLHDLRHSFAAVGAGSGLSLHMIGKLLGHSQPQTTARYAHLAADPLRSAAEVIGARIAAVMSGQPAASVVEIKGHVRKGAGANHGQ